MGPGRLSADEPDDLPDLSGVWSKKVVTTSVSRVPVVGKVTTETTTLQRVDVEQDGASIVMVNRVCDIDIESSVSAVRTIIPDTFVEAIGETRREARLTRRDDGVWLAAPKNHQILGARLRAPDSEHLPDQPDDARVRDEDNDGHPGVTVRVEGMISGELYVVHRGWDQFEGPVDGSSIRGEVTWGQDQSVLDSSSIFLKKTPETNPHPDSSRSTFEMRRLDQTQSCDTLKKSARND